jgi:predicted transcriptional regulator
MTMSKITTIQISTDTKAKLDKMKISSRDTYNDVIENLIEDSMTLSDETKKEIEESMEEYKHGKVFTLAEVKKDLGM